jgi:hypothetical protein
MSSTKNCGEIVVETIDNRTLLIKYVNEKWSAEEHWDIRRVQKSKELSLMYEREILRRMKK